MPGIILWATAVPIYLLPVFLLLILFLFVRAWRVGDAYGRIDLLLILFLLGYLFLHWLLAVPVWDRYILPLVPLVAVLFGRGVMEIGNLRLRDWWPAATRLEIITHYASRITFVILFLLLIIPAIAARNGRFPVGGQRDADGGAAQIAAFLADEPYGTVLYDHWYSWQWAYHLFDDRVYVSWFPYADALVEDLTVFGRDGSSRYIALPDTAVAQPIHRALNDAGFTLQPVGNAGNIALFEIIPSE